MDIRYLINNPANQPKDSVLNKDYSLSNKRNFPDSEPSSKRFKLKAHKEIEDTIDLSTGDNSSRRSTTTSICSISSITSNGVESPSVKDKNDINDCDTANDVIEINPNSSKIHTIQDLLDILSQNCNNSLKLSKISFKDVDLPTLTNSKLLTNEQETKIRQNIINKIHERYVEPLLSITGYKWIRKEVPSKGKGLKIFSIKYLCSQQKINLKKNSDRSRQLTYPLKQFTCESSYSIKYIWSSQTVEISYNHLKHPPYKRLPEKLKPFILERLDMKASDLYNEILREPKFKDIKHLIFFSKVQSFWSKERTKKKEESTKEAFQKFFAG